MTCKECRKVINDWLQNSWSIEKADNFSDVYKAVEKHIDTCRDCAAAYSSAELLSQPQKLQVEAPAGFTEAISRKVLADARETKKIRRFTGPRKILPQWLGLSAAAALLVITTVFLTLTISGRLGGKNMVVVRLQIEAPNAQSVSVVGDWNDWQPDAQTLTDADRDGIWEIEFKIDPEQEYQYQFLINEEKWVPDPSAPLQVDDGFGGKNSILNI